VALSGTFFSLELVPSTTQGGLRAAALDFLVNVGSLVPALFTPPRFLLRLVDSLRPRRPLGFRMVGKFHAPFLTSVVNFSALPVPFSASSRGKAGTGFFCRVCN